MVQQVQCTWAQRPEGPTEPHCCSSNSGQGPISFLALGPMTHWLRHCKGGRRIEGKNNKGGRKRANREREIKVNYGGDVEREIKKAWEDISMSV